MFRIITFLWQRTTQGYQLPYVVNYTADHVNKLESMLKRNLNLPHELICITDMPEGINCRTIELWDKCKSLGGCYNRLYIFSEDMKDLIGDRFACIDLDCVITGNVDHIFRRTEPFLINRYGPSKNRACRQTYNGGLIIMDAGVHDDVWTSFDPLTTPLFLKKMNDRNELVGSDQAWISYKIYGAPTVGTEHGIYNARVVDQNLPSDAAIVFFAGKRDPTEYAYRWVLDHYY